MARRTNIVRRPKANKAWSFVQSLGFNVGAASTKVTMGQLALSNPGIDETALRWVGVLSIETDQVAANENQEGAFGIIRVRDTARVAGVASLPSPLVNGDEDWIVHVPFLQRFVLQSAVGFETSFRIQYKFDFKTKRRLSNGEEFVFVLESTANSAGFTANLILRVLGMISR